MPRFNPEQILLTLIITLVILGLTLYRTFSAG